MTALTSPLLLAPIVIPASGVYFDVDGSDVTLTEGEYYWGVDENESGSFNEHLAARLAADYGGTWTVEITSGWVLRLEYTGGSTPTTLTFDDTTALDATDLGASATADVATLTLTAKVYTGTYQPRWLWRSDEWGISDVSTPWHTTTVARSIFTRRSVTDLYGSGHTREVRCEAVNAARVYQHWGAQASHASVAGLETSEPWASLESLWLDAHQTETIDGLTPQLEYVADEDAFLAGTETRVTVEWDAEEDLGAEVLSEEPLLYVVTLKLHEVA